MGCMNTNMQERKQRDTTKTPIQNQNIPSSNQQSSPKSEEDHRKNYYQNQINLGDTNSRLQSRRPPIQTLENVPETSQQISQTISELQRRRYPNNLNPEDEQNQIQQRPIEISYQVSQLDLLFILFRALRNQNMDQRDNLILFLRLLDLLAAEPEAQGLNQSLINNLERRNAVNGSDSCPVCQESIIQNDEILVLPCRHPYHPECIIPWLEKSNKCPVCRTTVEINSD